MNRLRRVFAAEVVLAVLSAVAFTLTLAWPDWIETIFGVDPDHGNSSLEWVVTAGLLAVALTLTAGARVTWRRIRAAT